LLDWDLPLSQQSEKVRKAVTARLEKLRQAGAKFGEDPTGEMIARIFSPQHGVDEIDFNLGPASQASQALREAGVPGIRYLDQGSRTAHVEEDLRRAASDLDRRIANAQKEISNLPNSFKGDYQAHIDDLLKERSAVQKKLEPTRNFVIFDDKLVKILGKE
jgi:hypothetical protein